MGTTVNGTFEGGKELRRKKVINRLSLQLGNKVKNSIEGVIPLTEKDISRIKNELSILKTRV